MIISLPSLFLSLFGRRKKEEREATLKKERNLEGSDILKHGNAAAASAAGALIDFRFGPVQFPFQMGI